MMMPGIEIEMENPMIPSLFWKNRCTLVTGHTGFKGAWLSLWLHAMGADVHGYSLKPPTKPSLYTLLDLKTLMHSHIGDVRHAKKLVDTFQAIQPKVVFHLAAQPLVRESYADPVTTWETNVMGLVNVLEAVRQTPSVEAVVIVTSDKCYENMEWIYPYRENDRLGGHDPYSASKACAELVADSYRRSFFQTPPEGKPVPIGLATARAGNVIGGGDWAEDRLLPDCFRALAAGKTIHLRNPRSTRPWQHVLEPLAGYLLLAQRLTEKPTAFSSAWNFGPDLTSVQPVEALVRYVCQLWGNGAKAVVDPDTNAPHEANLLTIDATKARRLLGWAPHWDLHTALEHTVAWYQSFQLHEDIRAFCIKDILAYQSFS